MLGVYPGFVWNLTLVDLRTPGISSGAVVGSVSCTGTAGSSLACSSPGMVTTLIRCSIVVGSYSWIAASSVSLFGAISRSLVSTALVSSSWSCGVSIVSGPYTPGSSILPMRQPLRLVKTSCSGSSLASWLTLSITVSGIGMASKLRRTIFFTECKLMNLYPPCRFPLGPRQMAPFVRGSWLFLGVSLP
jgi:hypothetical protein